MNEAVTPYLWIILATILGYLPFEMFKKRNKEKNEKQMIDNKNHEFEKKLALLQIAATVVATIGSVVIAMGISLVAFSMSISIDAANEKGEVYKFLRVVEGQSNISGYFLIAFGIIFFFIAIGLIASKVHRMRDLS